MIKYSEQYFLVSYLEIRNECAYSHCVSCNARVITFHLSLVITFCSIIGIYNDQLFKRLVLNTDSYKNIFYHRNTRAIYFQIVLRLNAMHLLNIKTAYIAIYQAFKRQKCNKYNLR